MFKRKQDKEVTLEIGLHPIETKVIPPNVSKIGKGGGGLSFTKVVLISGSIVMVGMVTVGVVMKNGKTSSQTPTTASTQVTKPKVTENQTTPKPKPTITPDKTTGVNDSTTGNVVTDPSKPTADSTSKPAPAYVDYKNFLLGVQMKYPSKWFLTERTNESLGVLNKSVAGGKFNINETVVDDVIQVADFTPSDIAKTKISVSLVPESKIKDKQSGVLKSTVPSGYTLVVAESPSAKDVNGVWVEFVNYVLEDNLKIKHNTTQMVFPLGKSFVVLTGTAEDSGVIADKVAVMEEIIKSFKTS